MHNASVVESDWLALLGKAEVEPPADDEEIERLVKAVGAPLPKSYLEMLRAANGAEGWIGENYIQISTADAIAEDPYPFGEFFPGLLFFAGDGGEAKFGFDVREGSDRVIVVQDDVGSVIELSPSLAGFLQLLNEKNWSDVWRARYLRSQ
jgi:hypothetical protein